jgi:hypothetical protein
MLARVADENLAAAALLTQFSSNAFRSIRADAFA